MLESRVVPDDTGPTITGEAEELRVRSLGVGVGLLYELPPFFADSAAAERQHVAGEVSMVGLAQVRQACRTKLRA